MDTTNNGGNTAFSADADTASLAVASGSLSGFVYIDADNDGLRMVPGGSAHLAIPGVVVRLLSADSQGKWTAVSGKSPVQTGADGSYHFDGLAPGNYRIQEVQPGNYLDGKETLGKIGGAVKGTAGPNSFDVPLGAGESGSEYNFGERGLMATRISQWLFLASTPLGAVCVTQANAVPTVDLSKAAAGTGYSVTLASGGSPVAIAAADAAIADADGSYLAGMTATIVNPLDGSAEKLTADTAGTPITSSYANGVLKLAGLAEWAAYEQVLRSIRYSDTATSPTGGNRTIDVVVNDGITDSEPAVATVTVRTAALDAALSQNSNWL